MMRTRFSFLRDRLRNSFWFTPALMMLGAVVLAILTLAVDERLSDEDLRAVPGLHTIVYSGGTDGAREVLGLDRIALRGRGRELGARLVLELGEHDGEDGDGAHHHDEGDAALARTLLLPAERRTGDCRARLSDRAHLATPKESACCVGIWILVT